MDSIVGYTFNAENFDATCILPSVKASHPLDYPIASTLMPGDDTEIILSFVARQLGIDRSDESTFDSGDFPKVIFGVQIHADCDAEMGCLDRCAGCGHPIGHECEYMGCTHDGR